MKGFSNDFRKNIYNKNIFTAPANTVTKIKPTNI